MARKQLDMNCSMAHALELIGEWWTILIVREAFFGSRRFEDFSNHLGIARNILTVRLKKLCDSGILKRVPISEGARRHEYRLTEMGHALMPTLVALSQWGDQWVKPGDAPVIFAERATGKPVQDVAVLSREGKKLKARDMIMLPGPGADAETRQRLQKLRELWQARYQKNTR